MHFVFRNENCCFRFAYLLIRCATAVTLAYACVYLPGNRAVLWLRARLGLQAEEKKQSSAYKRLM